MSAEEEPWVHSNEVQISVKLTIVGILMNLKRKCRYRDRDAQSARTSRFVHVKRQVSKRHTTRSGLGHFGDGRFGDQSSTVLICQIIYGAQIKKSEDQTFCFISNIR